MVGNLSELGKLSKEEISDRLNQLLGTNSINFTRMTKDDLVELHEVLSKLLKPVSEMSVREIVDELFGNKPLRERVFPRARKRIREILKTPEKKEES